MILVCQDNKKFPESGQLISAAKKLGIKVFDSLPIPKSLSFNPTKEEEEVYKRTYEDIYIVCQEINYFIYGTRPFFHKSRKNWSDIFCDQEHIYDYSFLYSIVPEQLLFNPQIEFSTSIGLIRAKLEDEKYFVRPNDGNKSFTGQVLSRAMIKNGLFKYFFINKYEMLAYAKAKVEPEEEWRFFCLNMGDSNTPKVDMLWCRYWDSSGKYEIAEPPEGMPGLVEIVAKELFRQTFTQSVVIDMAYSKDTGSKVLEFNSWNSSSFYTIPPKDILNAILKFLENRGF